MMLHKSLLPALLAGAALGFASAAHCDALDDIMKAKVIRVAVPQDFAPFGSAGLDLKPQGYDIDMANLIGKDLGLRVEIIPVTSANRIAYLQTWKADIVISSLGKTPEREKVIDFSNAYAPFFSGVFGAKNVTVSKVEDLAGKTVGATRGAIEEQELTKIAEKSPARAPILKFIIKDSPCFIGLNKNEPKLLAKLNEIVAKAKSSGELAKFSEKWLKAPLPESF